MSIFQQYFGALLAVLTFTLPTYGQVHESVFGLSPAQALSMPETTDTLGLPFADDFSYPSHMPTPALWRDRKVWVNDAMAIGQNSIGVATFDGLNEYGMPYKQGGLSTDSMTDVLTSAYLDLSGKSNVWLSFQFQQAGRGEAPTANDSLVVQFYSPVTATWTSVWSTAGTGAGTPFRTAMVPVVGQVYYQRGMAFRIASYGAAGGAYDTWNIDYVQLDADRNASDSIITEPAMSLPHPLIIGNGLYTSWPWWLSMSNILANRPDDLKFTYRRLGVIPPGGWSLNMGRYTWRENGQLIASQTNVPVITSTQHNVDLNFTVNVPASALVLPSGPTTVETKVWYDGSAAGFRSNDTVRGTLELDNYLALDDNTAERAYAVQNVTGGRVAQKFRVDGLGGNDSLKGVLFSFVQAGAPYKGTFRLAVWASADTMDAPGDRIYLSDSAYEVNYGWDRGDWIPYELDSAVDLSSHSYVWVGYVCSSATPMYVGLDVERELPTSLPRYYGDGFNWYPSLESGTMLMRPYFRYSPADMGTRDTDALTTVKILPNPARDQFFVIGAVSGSIVVSDMQGRKFYEVNNASDNHSISVEQWPAGLYVVRVQRGQNWSVEKIMVQ
jgi:hypothetical protein